MIKPLSDATLEGVILNGDLSKLTQAQKIEYVTGLCTRLGLDPATQPLKLMSLNGKLIVYADRSCASQLNRLHHLSHQITSTERVDDVFIVNARCTGPDGRYTEEMGAVSLAGLKGESLANAMMKARTKAMRRATLTHVGLGFLDEEETETIAVQIENRVTKAIADRPGDAPQVTNQPETPLADWTAEESKEAYAVIMGYADELLERGYEQSVFETEVLAPKNPHGNPTPIGLIGDPETPYSEWSRKIVPWLERMDKKYPKKSV
jgi:hypothetical protein